MAGNRTLPQILVRFRVLNDFVILHGNQAALEPAWQIFAAKRFLFFIGRDELSGSCTILGRPM
jgi:hypothetical protein